jgi:hypothetical protein
MIRLSRVPSSQAPAGAPQEVQEPADVPRGGQLRVPGRPCKRRPQEIPVQVDVVLKIRRDQVRNAVRNVLAVKPVIKIISCACRFVEQSGQRREPAPGYLQPPVIVKHGE